MMHFKKNGKKQVSRSLLYDKYSKMKRSCGAIFHDISTWINIPCDQKIRSSFICEDYQIFDRIYVMPFLEYYCAVGYIYIKHQCVKLTETINRCEGIMISEAFHQLEILYY